MRGGTLWRSVVRAVGAAASAMAGAANVAYCTLAAQKTKCAEASNHQSSCDCDCCTNFSSSVDASSFVVLQPGALQPLNFSNSEHESSTSWPRSPQASEIEAASAPKDWIKPPPYKMATSPTDPLSPALMEAFSRLQQNSQGQISKK